MSSEQQITSHRFRWLRSPETAVGVVWLACVIAASVLARINTNIFMADDVAIIPYMTGHEPVTWKYLWSQLNEHRIPIPRLVMLGAYAVSGGDFRAPAYLNVAILAALALVMPWVAKRVRGRTAYADAFFPLAVLSLAQHETFLYGILIAFVAGTFLAGLVLATIVTTRERLSSRSAVLAAACLVALPLCGAQGVMWAIPLGSWLALAAIGRLRTGGRSAFPMIAGCIAVYAVVACYFIDLSFGPTRPPGLAAFFKSTIQFFFLCAGRPGSSTWPIIGGLVGLFYLGSLALVGRVYWKCPEERLRAAGLFLFLLAGGLQAAGVAWGRAGMGEVNAVYWTSRYATLAVPLVCCLYFVWGLYGNAGRLRFVLPAYLLLVAALTPFTVKYGFRYAELQIADKLALDKTMRDGLPMTIVAHRFVETFHLQNPESYVASLRMLAEAGFEPFQRIDRTGEIDEHRLAVDPSRTHAVSCEGMLCRADGAHAHVEFDLASPRFVYCVRIRYCIVEPANVWSETDVSWGTDEGGPGNATERKSRFHNHSGKESVHTFIVNDTIDRFRLYPFHRPCVFDLREITVVEPNKPR